MINENALHERTQDAYSFYRYGAEAWMNAIRLLAGVGYTEEEVEWILRSKYMRWAADQFGMWLAELDDPDDPHSDNILDGSEIIKYRDQYGIDIEQE